MNSKKTIKTHSLGYPRIGEKRELKKATESYWKGKLPLSELLETGKAIRETNWKKQQSIGIDLIPVNDFSFYDQVLDMSCLLGNVPPRFKWDGGKADTNTAFTIARGTEKGSSQVKGEKDCQTNKVSTFASEMTKWFDTNYHFIVPEFRADTKFSLSGTKVFDECLEAQKLGINAKPVLVGPVTYLSLGKVQDSENPNLIPFTLFDNLIEVYEEIIVKLANMGIDWIQIDEPILSTDISIPIPNEKVIKSDGYTKFSRSETPGGTTTHSKSKSVLCDNSIWDGYNQQHEMLKTAYERLSKVKGSTKLLIATYFGGVRENLNTYLNLPVDGLHFDFVRGAEDIDTVLANYPKDKVLSIGIVEGRNIWKNDYTESLKILEKAKSAIADELLWIAPSCSLLHSPITLQNEQKLDEELKGWMAFADEKLLETVELSQILVGTASENLLIENSKAIESRKSSTLIHNKDVKARVSEIKPKDFLRKSQFLDRQSKQREKLSLPEFPTTTIGSFPQTPQVRKVRAQWKKGALSDVDYDKFLKEETAKCVEFQDEIGIDMPVHGEFERNDMVEYFGELLEGFAFTSNGWVQSFGTRCVKPPVIFGDVSRPEPMTVYWSKYAQSLTKRPMKGMLTGPVTILQWSFVRDDQPRSVTLNQIALAIRDEVLDLESANVAAIQIDEPAFREGLPLRRSEWNEYLDVAVKAFRLSASGVRDDTQIHTHMCYSEFNDIIDSIADMDADVITIETSRSNMELLEAFVDFKYPNEIGPGVYDIHSPRVPKEEEMVNLMKKAQAVIPSRNLWINPDCGLKTRRWEEVKPSLINLVASAKRMRSSIN